ncbi:MAG: polyprenyl synthetase family protein [Bacteroidia bacterium]|nr:polyprenyl synthetase family protein [Bacteroidia bacterium]MDW8134277.1 polyprenyl synthetase family protein [Bacteroidia bacterium]
MWNVAQYEAELLSLCWPEMGEWEKWMHYALAGGGKRLRPWLAWLSYDFYTDQKGDWQEALPLLKAIELLHTFTLVHDDVMDHSAWRRGRPTIFKQTDENTAILIGDALLISVYEVLSNLQPSALPEVTRILSRAAYRVCHGQLLDLQLSRKPTYEVSMEDYMQMILEKTGALMGAALEAGAALAGAPPEEKEKLRKTGEEIGRFFQLQDDYLDAFGEHTGKAQGGDIAESKKTFLWLWAYAEADPEEKRLLEDEQLTPENRRRAGLALYEKLKLRDKGKALLEQTYQNLQKLIDTVLLAPKLREVGALLYNRKL